MLLCGTSPQANLAKGEIPGNNISKFSINILKVLRISEI